MQISIITVALNAASTIRDTIDSVLSQSWTDLEYIIIDGGSTDGSREIIESYGARIARFISEPDRGMYDAMNKGIGLASGDVVGILNADDVYTGNNVLEKVAKALADHETGVLFADVHFVKLPDLNKPIRYISGRYFKPWMLRFGFMPPHPSCFIQRSLFGSLGLYKTDYEIAADYELIIRFIYTHRISFQYLRLDMVSMRAGGRSNSSYRSNLLLNREIVRACTQRKPVFTL